MGGKKLKKMQSFEIAVFPLHTHPLHSLFSSQQFPLPLSISSTPPFSLLKEVNKKLSYRRQNATSVDWLPVAGDIMFSTCPPCVTYFENQ